jgi:hypothetical protein
VCELFVVGFLGVSGTEQHLMGLVAARIVSFCFALVDRRCFCLNFRVAGRAHTHTIGRVALKGRFLRCFVVLCSVNNVFMCVCGIW